MKEYIRKKTGKSLNTMKTHTLTEEEEKEAKAALIAAQDALPYSVKNVEGDASETGLIRFSQLVMDIDTIREQYPVFAYEKNEKKVESKIPFSSETKFNLFIRDSNKDNLLPKSAEDNLVVVMKGAPERIINRCSKIIINGEERDFDEQNKAEVNLANTTLGKLGERVLALAICKLDPTVYTKDPAYQFDIETWKSW
jgi:sodium/potassium-transporting ATPase subunit alpha